MLKCAIWIRADISMTTSNTGFLTICKITSLLEYVRSSLSSSSAKFIFISLTPKMTRMAERKMEMDVHLNVSAYVKISAIAPPIIGPINDPVILPVCNVPSILPATRLDVCVDISACEVGIKPVKKPISIRNKKSCWMVVAKPINNRQIPRPVADMIKISFLPYRSPNFPQTGANNNAVTNVIPKIQPDQFCTYESEKSPRVSMCSEMNGKIIVILPATKKLANHMIAKFRFKRESKSLIV